MFVVLFLTLLGLGLIKINEVSANFNNPRPSLIYIIICQSVSVCPNAISSHIYGQISNLKVPMEFLSQGGPNKTICKVIRPEIKKKYIIEAPFFNSTTYLAFHVRMCV